MAKVALYPKKSGAKHVKKGETARAAFKNLKTSTNVAAAMPIRQPAVKVSFTTVAAALQDPKRGAFKTLRQERINAKLDGRRKKKAAEAAEAAEKPSAAQE